MVGGVYFRAFDNRNRQPEQPTMNARPAAYAFACLTLVGGYFAALYVLATFVEGLN